MVFVNSLLLTIAVLLFQTVSGQTNVTGDEVTYGVDVTDWLPVANAGDVLVNGKETYTIIETAEYTANLTSRQFHCTPITFLQTNVDRTGTWWGGWFKASSCFWCGQSERDCTRSLGYGQSYSKTFSASFTASGTAGALSAINGNGGLNLGYSWTEEKSYSDSWTCTAPNGGVVRVWRRNKMGWSDNAQRWGYTTTCGGNINYSGWWFSHNDWPIWGRDDYDIGCSTGAAAEC